MGVVQNEVSVRVHEIAGPEKERSKTGPATFLKILFRAWK
jgi:hypothetical protein